MISKVVTDRLKATNSVVASLKNLASTVSDQAKALLEPHLEKGEKLPDLGHAATLIARMLEERAGAMEKADAAHNKELSDDAEPRDRRDETKAAVYAALVEVKQGTVALFGEKWVPRLKLPSEIPQDPAALSRVAAEVIEALAEVELPAPLLEGVKHFDVKPWIKKIAGPSKELAGAIKDVAREEREAQATLIKKNRAMSDHADGFSKGVAFAQALLRLVGENEHADRLRPNPRQPGTLEPSSGGDAAQGSDAAAGAGAASKGEDPKAGK
jgi:hypothetical protein